MFNTFLSCGSAVRRAVVLITILSFAFPLTQPAGADETDQFLVPKPDEFVDLGPYLTLVHYQVLEEVVDNVNRDIERALRVTNERRRNARLARLQSSQILANGVRERFGPGFFEMRIVEHALRIPEAREAFGDQLTAYRNPTWIYFHAHLPIDPRRLILMFQGSTLKAYGVLFGTDKFGHFHDLGHIYYSNYRSLLRQGYDEDEALDIVVQIFSEGLISEGGIIGLLATGVYSNADLASNYAGMMFNINLTEPISLGDRDLPPMIVRIGEFWALNHHVRPYSDFIEPFITQHWNEALNPNLYEWGMRGPIMRVLEENADHVLRVYADEDGQPKTREFFERKAQELSTYFGADYGHSGFREGVIGIAEACFPEEDKEPEYTQHNGQDQRASLHRSGTRTEHSARTSVSCCFIQWPKYVRGMIPVATRAVGDEDYVGLRMHHP